jgi:predicted dehydrogenase
MADSRPFRFGLIGGKWGLNYLRTVAGRPEWSIPVVARARDQALPPPFHEVPVTTTWRNLGQEHWNLDAVIIATPPNLHHEMAAYFMGKNIPVLIEKPLCLDPREADLLVELAERNHGIAWVDHPHLFHPAYRALKIHLGQQSIRRIVSRAGNYGPFRNDVPVFWDWLPHDMAMILDLLHAMPERMIAREKENRRVPEGIGSVVELTLSFAREITTHTTVSNISTDKHRLFCVMTDTSWYQYDGIGPCPLTRLPSDIPDRELGRAVGAPLPVESALPLDCLLREFCEAIQQQDSSTNSLALGRQVVQTLDEGWRQILTG